MLHMVFICVLVKCAHVGATESDSLWVMWEQVMDGSWHLWEVRGLGSAALLLQLSQPPLCDQQREDPHSPRTEKAALERIRSFQNHLPSQTQQDDPLPGPALATVE